jgi:hypothetical protein
MLPTRALYSSTNFSPEDTLGRPVPFSKRTFAVSPEKWILGHQTADTQSRAILFLTQYCGSNKIFIITDADIKTIYGRFDAELYERGGTALEGYIALNKTTNRLTFYYDNLVLYAGARPPASLAERIVLAHSIFAKRYKKDPIIDVFVFAHRPVVNYIFAQQLTTELTRRDDAVVFFPLTAAQGPPMVLTL